MTQIISSANQVQPETQALPAYLTVPELLYHALAQSPYDFIALEHVDSSGGVTRFSNQSPNRQVIAPPFPYRDKAVCHLTGEILFNQIRHGIKDLPSWLGRDFNRFQEH